MSQARRRGRGSASYTRSTHASIGCSFSDVPPRGRRASSTEIGCWTRDGAGEDSASARGGEHACPDGKSRPSGCPHLRGPTAAGGETSAPRAGHYQTSAGLTDRSDLGGWAVTTARLAVHHSAPGSGSMSVSRSPPGGVGRCRRSGDPRIWDHPPGCGSTSSTSTAREHPVCDGSFLGANGVSTPPRRPRVYALRQRPLRLPSAIGEFCNDCGDLGADVQVRQLEPVGEHLRRERNRYRGHRLKATILQQVACRGDDGELRRSGVLEAYDKSPSWLSPISFRAASWARQARGATCAGRSRLSRTCSGLGESGRQPSPHRRRANRPRRTR